MNTQQNSKLIELAKEKFIQFSIDDPEKMTLKEFKNFLEDFFKTILFLIKEKNQYFHLF